LSALDRLAICIEDSSGLPGLVGFLFCHQWMKVIEAETATYKPLVKESIQVRIPDADRSFLQENEELSLLI
jgi:hypothetical protein